MTPTQPQETTSQPLTRRGQRLILIAWLFLALVGATLGFAYYSMGVLSAARAFVGGEGLWSKAERDAIYALSRYANTRDARDYEAYSNALGIILGDRQFRLELEKPQPDLQISRQGLLQGRNHPADVDGMIGLFRNFRHMAEIDRAVTLWATADASIDHLRIVGERLHTAVQAQTLDAPMASDIQEELHQISLTLAPLADAFSYSLGEASRRAKSILLWTMFVSATLLAAAALVFSRRLVRDSETLQQALQEGERQVQKLLQAAPFPMTITLEHTGTVLYANARALAQFKTTMQDLQHAQSKDFYCRPDERAQWVQRFQGKDSMQDWEVEMKDSQGGRFWALVSTQRIQFQGRECLLHGLNNIQLRKRAEEALHHLAYHDELTSLPNRAMCMDALRRILCRCERKNMPFSILFIDLDHFKAVNDQWGHAAGDQLLQQVAQRIQRCMRGGDLVARLGGDEFIAVVEELHDTAELHHIADKILHTVEPVYLLCGHSVHVTASIGISTYPQDGTDLQQLLTRADKAMYHAKASGRNDVSFYTSP
ncbi:MAG: sensor domain-containing diguanylate cyclase [Rhodoferax sp.]|uniref:sensor domain-containing diguanylate cyclase n=1 Tax=Rhodoferax sp. TaxID=50421 RepID=UPI00326425D4